MEQCIRYVSCQFGEFCAEWPANIIADGAYENIWLERALSFSTDR